MENIEEKIEEKNMLSAKAKAWIAVLLIVLIVVSDQLLKIYIKTHYLLGEQTEITSWFKIVFVENKGMAFGMEFIATWLLSAFRLLAIPLFLVFIYKSIKKQLPLGVIICLSMIVAGAAGNIIDNCFYGLGFSESLPYGSSALPAEWVGLGHGYGKFLQGHVVDMFYFPLFDWPSWVPFLGGQVFFNAIFNIADASISCGAVAMFLFYSKYILNTSHEKN